MTSIGFSSTKPAEYLKSTNDIQNKYDEELFRDDEVADEQEPDSKELNQPVCVWEGQATSNMFAKAAAQIREKAHQYQQQQNYR